MTGALRFGKVQGQRGGCVAAALAFSGLGAQSSGARRMVTRGECEYRKEAASRLS